MRPVSPVGLLVMCAHLTCVDAQVPRAPKQVIALLSDTVCVPASGDWLHAYIMRAHFICVDAPGAKEYQSIFSHGFVTLFMCPASGDWLHAVVMRAHLTCVAQGDKITKTMVSHCSVRPWSFMRIVCLDVAITCRLRDSVTTNVNL